MTVSAKSRTFSIPYYTMFKRAPDGILITDADGNLIEFNEEACSQLGYSKEEFEMLKMADIDPFSNIEKTQSRVLAEGQVELEARFLTREGNLRYVNAVVQSLDLDGNRVFYTFWRDITRRKKLEKKLQLAARTDKMTGIYNRNRFEEILESEIKRAKRYGTLLSLIMFDLDHLKEINDVHGHQIGDYVLKSVAKIVSKNLRETDYFGRWGGDEFMILALQLTPEKAAELTQKISRIIEDYEFSEVGKVTISCGWTQFNDKDTSDDLIKRVDGELYAAKKRRIRK